MHSVVATLLLSSVLALEQKPRFSKYFTIVFENTDFDVAMEQAFFKNLASKGRLLTNMHAMTHPSQPNYIDMIAGTNFGQFTDNNVECVGPTVPDLLEAKGFTWKSYNENYPGGCNATYGTEDHLYMRKHTPFMSFASIRENEARCANIVDEKAFEADVASGKLPDYIFYTPNQIHDGHGVPPYGKTEHVRINEGSQWFATFFPAVLNNPAFKDTLFVVTFDENDVTGDFESKQEGSDKPDSLIGKENLIYTVLIGAGVQAGSVDNTKYNHHSGIALLEKEWGLGSLGTGDVTATPFRLSDAEHPPVHYSTSVAAYSQHTVTATTAMATSSPCSSTTTPPPAYSTAGPAATSTYAIYQSSAMESAGVSILAVVLAFLAL